jgi:hypothetical protein
MNTRIRPTIAAYGLAIFNFSIAAVQAQFDYTTNNGTITITRYAGPGGAVTIPDTITGLPVTTIGQYFLWSNGGWLGAFQGCSTLTSVTISTNVTSIGEQAFCNCYRLASITMSTSVVSIGSSAFGNCTSLTSVTIPNSVISIGDGAFGGCTSLTSVTIPISVASIGIGAFNSCTRLTNVTIGTNVTSIGYGAFNSCTSLTNVVIGTNVTSIGGFAFQSCTSLSSITIPNSVTNIGDEAFYRCTRLTSITIDPLNSFYSSLAGVLFNKNQTMLIQCPEGKAGSHTIPNGVTSIGVLAFYYCTNLTSVTIPNSVTSIPSEMFDQCGSLANVSIPNSVTSIGTGAFSACTNLTGVVIPNSVTNIGDGAFDSTRLTSVTIPNSVTSLGVSAFGFCTSLTNVTIPNSVTSIGDAAFQYCTGLASIYFMGNAPSLTAYAFNGDNNATVYYLPGTTGWDTTYGGRPTAVWWIPPTIQGSPLSQTAEVGSRVDLRVEATCPLYYLWYLNNTNLISCSTNCDLELTNVQFSQSGAYTVIVTNVDGAVTSSPAMLQVIPPVERRPVRGVKVTGEAGSLWNVDHADSLSPAPLWTPLGSVSLTGTLQYCFDLALPLPPQRFYRAWQTGTPGVRPSLDLHLDPAITLTGTIGHSVRLDYINQFGPTDAWVTLDTVTLTNTSQLYFDVSAPGQPQRLYRLVQVP